MVGAMTFAVTNPRAQREVAWPWRSGGKALMAMDWPTGINAAPKAPWTRRQITSCSRVVAVAQPNSVTV